MPRLHVFNPDHDYALGNDRSNYMAPASVRKLAIELQRLPIIWSRQDDYLLLADNSIIKTSDMSQVSSLPYDILSVEPWGWDKALTRRLKCIGLAEALIPDSEYLDRLRRLSHRRISIDFNRFLESPSLPVELKSEEEALSFFMKHPGCYLKMPWSSGGRGILATRELNSSQVREWARGCIRRQGSLMGEKGHARALDFASLWDIDKKNVTFLGFSISISDGRGKYDGNLYGPQPQMESLIKKKAPALSASLIERQRMFLLRHISPYYRGKAGIDMIATSDREVIPCVELNLRRTMGHVALDYYKMQTDEKNSHSWKRECCQPPLLPIEEFQCC